MNDDIVEKELRRFLESRQGIVFGFGGIQRFSLFPKENRPETFLPGARSVISVAISIPATAYDWELRCQNEEQKGLGRAVYHAAVQTASERLDQYMYDMVAILADCGYTALWTPTVLKSEAPTDQEKERPWAIRGLMSQVMAGYVCGVGSIGMNHLLLTAKYGPRIRLNSLITDAVLSETPLSKNLCIHCERCMKACPARAFRKPDYAKEEKQSVYNSEACWKSRILYRTNLHCDFGERCAAVCPVGTVSRPDSARMSIR